ncbi:hypothetical protein M6B38_386925 [Iris pallida]|uniref:Uncharacterized protein n=1 Tax=Iris pallida TaxID=29817 RepID=A0AAX6G1W4_IRIPA|nr:hypothetical protein M6B38_386925 [Iris pallida]
MSFFSTTQPRTVMEIVHISRPVSRRARVASTTAVTDDSSRQRYGSHSSTIDGRMTILRQLRPS